VIRAPWLRWTPRDGAEDREVVAAENTGLAAQVPHPGAEARAAGEVARRTRQSVLAVSRAHVAGSDLPAAVHAEQVAGEPTAVGVAGTEKTVRGRRRHRRVHVHCT